MRSRFFEDRGFFFEGRGFFFGWRFLNLEFFVMRVIQVDKRFFFMGYLVFILRISDRMLL